LGNNFFFSCKLQYIQMTYNAKDKMWRVRGEDGLSVALFAECDMI